MRVPSPIPLCATSHGADGHDRKRIALANSVSELDAGECDRRVGERLEPGHRRAAPLDRAVVLLNELVEVLVRPHFHVPPARMLAPQQPESTAARHVSVERQLARHARQCRTERLAEERLGGRNSTVASELKVYGLALLVEGALQIMPFPGDLR
jgi:hypothetical protein